MIGLLVMNQLIKGCDASIMLINPDGDDEWRSLDGITLKPEGFNTVMSAKAAVDSDPQCRNMVSCADILALAARDAVFLVIKVPLALIGRPRAHLLVAPDRDRFSSAERRAGLPGGAGPVRRPGVD